MYRVTIKSKIKGMDIYSVEFLDLNSADEFISGYTRIRGLYHLREKNLPFVTEYYPDLVTVAQVWQSNRHY